MTSLRITRRSFVGGAIGAAAGTALPRRAFAQLAMPQSPVALNIMDVTGDLTLTQPIYDNYRKGNPKLVAKMSFIRGNQPEMPAKLKAQQDGGKVDIDLVLCGYDGMTAGIDQKVWRTLLPDYASILPKPEDTYLPGALKIQEQAAGQGMCVSFSPYGPLIEYMPDKVKAVPSTVEELMAWCQQNNNRFMYSRPANSGPARALMAGLPWILGDRDPREPVKGWSKTWEYLKALDEHIEYYPGTTGATMKEFGEGSRDMVPTSLGFDINPRALGLVPKEAKTFSLKGFHWGTDGHFMCIPKGSSQENLPVVLDLMKYILTPAQQAYIYDTGYNYPGPSVKGVTIDMAPEESRKVIAEFGRPEYADLIANNPQEIPLTPKATVDAFRIWDEQIGGSKRRS